MNAIVNALWGVSFFFLAATCKAIADTLQHHFDTSIFKKLSRKWWDPNTSDDFVKYIPFTKYRLDAWHFANSLMITAMVLFGIYYQHIFPYKSLDIAFFGLLWNGVFNIFYNKIFR